jgi:hypothetical protein
LTGEVAWLSVQAWMNSEQAASGSNRTRAEVERIGFIVKPPRV